ncbi:MAG: hypothetical protein M1835_000321 [Candelina submexicana]|nr:MAG: hypothetical protein M1835_000321 [Candelina submexicana]
MFFHWIDTRDYLSQYRLHTPAEVLKRNHVSRWEVIRDVAIQQVIQTAVGWLLGMTEPDDYYGKEGYEIAVWARRIRIAQRAIPDILGAIGLDAEGLAQRVAGSYPTLGGTLAGGRYPLLETTVSSSPDPPIVPAFAGWEVITAEALYWYLVPAVQFLSAIVVVDTWQYFLHRAMHMNKWLYNTFHSRHHRLYVPYAFGALYNHPFEGFLLDTLGASVAFKLAGLSTRQGMWFFTGSTFKTVDDHCGYALPWDPLQWITSNNAGYHDVHHQTWGVKTNFSQPFFTFWDRLLGTAWTGGDVSARYERARLAAQRKVDQDGFITHSNPASSLSQRVEPYQNDLANSTILKSLGPQQIKPFAPSGKATQQAAGSREQVLEDRKDGGFGIVLEEAEEEKDAKLASRRTARKRSSGSTMQAGNFKGLRERVNGSLHGRTGARLGVESSR